MFYGTDNICKIFLTFKVNDAIFYMILSIPHKIVMALGNVMHTHVVRVSVPTSCCYGAFNKLGTPSIAHSA